MSGIGTIGAGPESPDEVVLLAGEYVLGTLPPDEAARVRLEAALDPALAGAIADWEGRFLPLIGLATPVEPPVELWPRIEATAHGRGSVAVLRPRPPAAARTRRGFWRGAAAARFLLAAGVAGIAILSRPVTGPLPTPVAVLSPIGAKPAAFLVEAQPGGALSVRPILPDAVPAGRDLELWSLPAGAAVPRPLGVLPAGGVRLAAGTIPAGGGQILVSLEPKGGSPTGLPTGPVLYGGAVSRLE